QEAAQDRESDPGRGAHRACVARGCCGAHRPTSTSDALTSCRTSTAALALRAQPLRCSRRRNLPIVEEGAFFGHLMMKEEGDRTSSAHRDAHREPDAVVNGLL